MEGFSFIRSGREGEVLIDGVLKIENAAEIRMKLADLIEKEDQVLLTIGKASEADLSFFQLVCSAHRTAVAMNKSFVVGPRRPAAFIRFSEEAGIKREKGCVFNVCGDCAWVLGGTT